MPDGQAGADAEFERVLAERFRERIEPRPGDQAYAHLVDLLDALRPELAAARGEWLDYGAGTSPYATLLPRARLRSADLATSQRYAVDFELDESGRIPAANETFDGVLSTQVLEHVADPQAYLAECHRVLRPGGRLALSTHGVWEDHGGVDLWRWTADGLVRQIEAAGFTARRSVKLTCGARAYLLLLQRQARAAGWPAAPLPGAVLRLAQRIDRRWPAAFDRYSDKRFGDLRIVESDAELLYLAVLVVAERRVG